MPKKFIQGKSAIDSQHAEFCKIKARLSPSAQAGLIANLLQLNDAQCTIACETEDTSHPGRNSLRTRKIFRKPLTTGAAATKRQEVPAPTYVRRQLRAGIDLGIHCLLEKDGLFRSAQSVSAGIMEWGFERSYSISELAAEVDGVLSESCFLNRFFKS